MTYSLISPPTLLGADSICFFRLLCEMHAFPALHLPWSSNTLHFFCCFPHIISLTSSNPPPNTVSRHVYLALKGRSRTRCGVSMSSLIINTNLFKSTLGSSCCHLVFRWYYPDGRLLLANAVYLSVTHILTAGFKKENISPDFKTSGSSTLLDGPIRTSGHRVHVYVVEMQF